jgi:hypothetical protein
VTDSLELIIERNVVELNRLPGSRGFTNESGSGSGAHCMKYILLTRQILEMKLIKKKMGFLFAYLIQEREGFAEKPHQEKVRGLCKQLEQVANEVPLLLHHLEEFYQQIQVDPRFEDKTFLFSFTGFAGQISAVLNHTVTFKDLIQPILRMILDNLQKDDLEAALADLGLLPHTNQPSDLGLASHTIQPHVSSGYPEHDGVYGGDQEKNEDLNLTGRFSTSHVSRVSALAQQGLQLFNSKFGADMEFVLDHDSPSPLAYTQDSRETSAPGTKHVIPAHRVIVCARCPWFLRALTSGMREARERRIVLRDCNLDIFILFLKFIYSGLRDINLSSLQAQTLADLLLLADRYEMIDLLGCCESSLCSKLDDGNVFSFLALGDQFNTHRLRRSCFTYISMRPHLLIDENIAELPPHLATEVQGLNAWVRPENATACATQILAECTTVHPVHPVNPTAPSAPLDPPVHPAPVRTNDHFTDFKYTDGDPFLSDPQEGDWSSIQRNSDDPFLLK